MSVEESMEVKAAPPTEAQELNGDSSNLEGTGGSRIDENKQDQQDINESKAEEGTSPSHVKSHKVSGRRSSKRIKMRKRRTPKIFQDAISVYIPIDVTADLKVAIQRTRTKRIQSIYRHFPSLRKANKKAKGDDVEAMDEDDDDSKKEVKEKPQKKKKKLEHVPQPEQYGSVLDYLEAKYVRGVMLGDEEADGESVADRSEGHGSVYSGGSFLDDTDLQRDVAEQVMANTTLTKLELEEDDADFFVNVGNLEVEDNQYGDHYDPAQDKDTGNSKKGKKTQSGSSSGGSQVKKAKKGSSKGTDALADSTKSKQSTTTAGSSKKKPSSATPKVEESESQKQLVAAAKKAKARSDALFKKVVAQVKSMAEDELPRRKTKLKVALTCPPNKKPGDDVTFTNPHNPGQRLRVKVPKDCFPGGTFKVSVPVKQSSGDDGLEDKDHNKFSREFQELVDEFARTYDDWCVAQSEADKSFALYKEKQGKFDALVRQFPTNLLTPIDSDYMKKIVRRARQNRHKRKKTAALKQDNVEGDTVEEDPEENVDMDDDQTVEPRIVKIPTMGLTFEAMKWDAGDFAL